MHRFIFHNDRDAVDETSSLTNVKHPSPSEYLAQIDRLVRSPLLLGSEELCKLLQYLAHHTLNTPAIHLKEYQIATEAFGRPSDFDPQTDSCVRVQMRRLRSKLAQYYDSDGVHDSILVLVPKGRYTLSFQSQLPASETGLEASVSDTTPLSSTRQAKAPKIQRRVILAMAILLVGIVTADALFRVYWEKTAAPASARQTPAAIRTFWSPFLREAEEPFVIFSNAKFVGTAETGMRYYEPSRDSLNSATQHYTGVGEVMGVRALDQLFMQHLGRSFYLKRAGLFTLDDAQNKDLIFVGSTQEDTPLEKISSTHEFVFTRLTSGPDQGKQAIVNLHPLPGEPKLFFPTQQAIPLEVDYAVIALVRGLDGRHWTLVLAGASTIGTEAAVKFVCNDNSLQELLSSLNIKNGTNMKPFEALLRVKVSNDVPLGSQLVLLHRIEL